MDAIILAGGIAGENDLLYNEIPNGYKALLPIAGKPMVQWTLDALNDSEKIENVILVGLPEDVKLSCEKNMVRVADHKGIIENIQAGTKKLLEMGRDPQMKALSVSADVPSITSDIVNWMVDTIESYDADIYYSVIERNVMEKRFPGSKRSYVKLKDYEVCGGDVNGFRLGAAHESSPLATGLASARKNVVKQASLVGFGTLFLLLTRQLSLHDAEKRICKRLKVTGKALVNPYAEIGMDVDKPFQLEIMRQELSQKI